MPPERFALTPKRPVFVRSDATLASYFLLALLTFSYGIVGPLMPSLRAGLDLTFAQGSWHSVAMALGMSIIGAVGDRLVLRFGRRRILAVALLGLTAGLVLLCGALHLVMSLAGALLIGGFGALVLVTAPTILAERHGDQVGIAYGEANVIAYIGIFVVPAIVNLADMTIGVRWSFLPIVLCFIAFWMAFRTTRFGEPAVRIHGSAPEPLGLAYWCFWMLLMLSVSAEICLLVWGASYFENEIRLTRETALLYCMIFPAGMIAGRIIGALLLRRLDAGVLAVPTLALAMAGFMLFIYGAHIPAVLSGFFLMGLGMANLYPVGITLAVKAVRGPTDNAMAKISLASGLAMISAPFLVGGIADRFGIVTAFWLIPFYLACAAMVSATGLGALRRVR